MRLAIVGSVELFGNTEAWARIYEVIGRWKPDVVVSGGAPGIDTMARIAAERSGIEVVEYKAKQKRWGGRMGFQARNRQIAYGCDVLVRIVASTSTTYGSGWTRDRARERGIPCEEYVISIHQREETEHAKK